MAIPKFNEVMLPLLDIVSDGEEHRFADLVDDLAVYFKLTNDEISALLPSGTYPVFRNRCGWAKTYLTKAGIMTYPRRGYVKITEVGKLLLKKNVSEINVDMLKTYPSFLAYYKPDHDNDDIAVSIPESTIPNDQTPDEIIDAAHFRSRSETIDSLNEFLKSIKPDQFERLVVELLVKMGFGGSVKEAGQAVGRSNDGGIDGIINQDVLGLEKIYIQAKKWDPKQTIGRPEIQKFAGALLGRGAGKGVFITTASFTKEAKNYKGHGVTIILIDGESLCQKMYDYNLGVSTIKTYELKRIDQDYFDNL